MELLFREDFGSVFNISLLSLQASRVMQEIKSQALDWVMLGDNRCLRDGLHDVLHLIA